MHKLQKVVAASRTALKNKAKQINILNLLEILSVYFKILQYVRKFIVQHVALVFFERKYFLDQNILVNLYISNIKR